MQEAPTERRVRRGPMVAVAGVVVAGAAVLGVALSASTATPAAAELASLEHGCQQWQGTGPGFGGDGRWCTDMARWMSQDMVSAGLGPHMMWGTPDETRSRCEQWIDSQPPSAAAPNPRARCGAMVEWMAGHVRAWSGQDSWRGWMTNGSMMGFAPAGRPGAD